MRGRQARYAGAEDSHAFAHIATSDGDARRTFSDQRSVRPSWASSRANVARAQMPPNSTRL